MYEDVYRLGVESQRRIADGFLDELLVAWRTELWPDPNDDPIFKENIERGLRDWREVNLTSYKPRRRLGYLVDSGTPAFCLDSPI